MYSTINLFISAASLLSGDPYNCLDPTNLFDESCSGGRASVSAVMRHSQSMGDGPGLHVPYLENGGKFVQMHPLGLEVNKVISRDRFKLRAFVSSPALFTTSSIDLSGLRHYDFRPVATNLDMSATSEWYPFIENIHFDEETRTAFLYLFYGSHPAAAPVCESLVVALDYIAHLNDHNAKCGDDGSFIFDTAQKDEECYWSPVIFFDVKDKELFKECLQAALNHPHPPLIFYAYGNFDDNHEYSQPKIVGNGTTVVFDTPQSGKTLTHLRVEFGDAGNQKVVTNLTWNETNIGRLPLEFKDDAYVEDLKFLRTLADQALENDPIVGYSGYMPFTREGNWRKCMGGECPIGNLFTDAIRWMTNSDIAILNSGGLRGPGWDAGPVRVSDIYGALPFINNLCTGVMSGVSVFRMFNYSTAVATFESTFTSKGDRLLQMSGMKISYNTLLDGSGPGRLMSVDVWDHEAQEYLPLERLKLYKFTTDNWMCNHFDQFPSFLKSDLVIDGESPGIVDPENLINIQSVVGAYLVHLKELNITYDTSNQGKFVNDTNAFEPLAFIQTADSCSFDSYWESKTQTCTPCPGGKHVLFSDKLISFSITHDSEGVKDGRNVLSNRELYDVTVAPRSFPPWVVLRNSTSNLMEGSTVLKAGESIAIDFDVNALVLSEGTTRSTVALGVILDGEFPGCLTDLDVTYEILVEITPEENLNHINNIRPVGLALMALAMTSAVVFSLWTHKLRKHRVVKASQPLFLELIGFGTFVMASSIVPLSIDDSIASERGCSMACIAFPWLFSLGFAITFSALYAKIWRLNKVTNAARQFRKLVITEQHGVLPIVAVFTINGVLLLCWTLIDPLKWQRQPVKEGDPSSTYGFCESEGNASTAFITLLVLLDLSALVLACVQAYRARDMNDELTESRWLGVACASWVQVLAIGAPVIALTRNQPVASYFVRSALVFLVCVSMLLFMFVPKMMLVYKKPQEAPKSSNKYSKQHVNTSQQELKRYQDRINQLEQSLKQASANEESKNSDLETPSNYSNYEGIEKFEDDITH